jgi:transposase InsO family protein
VTAFVDGHRARFGVEPICKALQVAPSAYWRESQRRRDPALCPPRRQREAQLLPEIERVWNANMRVYGADKVWKQLNRERIEVARCTVERLMRRLGLRGVVRGKRVRTTVPDAKAACPLDRVNREFHAERPNQLWVSDFTYVSTWQGFVYVAFVIDVFARCIVGWRVSSSMQTDFVLDALEQALYARRSGREGDLIHHSDRGSQYVSIRYSERLAEAGIEPSVGSKGDSYDNALAETINGLYKAELIHRRAPWKTREAVELATLEWVSWFNHHRLLEPIGYIPPAEAEENYWRQQRQPGGPPAAPAGSLKKGESNSRSQQILQV